MSDEQDARRYRFLKSCSPELWVAIGKALQKPGIDLDAALDFVMDNPYPPVIHGNHMAHYVWDSEMQTLVEKRL